MQIRLKQYQGELDGLIADYNDTIQKMNELSQKVKQLEQAIVYKKAQVDTIQEIIDSAAKVPTPVTE